MTGSGTPTSRLTLVLCRALDIVLASLLLAALAPVLFVVALAIMRDSRGWVIYRQIRLGRELKPFTSNKFRTMRTGATHDVHRTFVALLIAGEADAQQAANGALFKLAEDARVTPVGRFLRRSSLDELPQLWNVPRGDMSLVGPRPPVPYEVERYPPHAFRRFAVKPGLTGLWQVSGRSALSFEEMIRLDIEYVERRSVWLNLRVLARSVPAVLRGQGAV